MGKNNKSIQILRGKATTNSNESLLDGQLFFDRETDTLKIGKKAFGENSDKLSISSAPTITVADSAIVTAKIADSAVTTNKIEDSAVTTNKIANSAITSAKLHITGGSQAGTGVGNNGINVLKSVSLDSTGVLTGTTQTIGVASQNNLGLIKVGGTGATNANSNKYVLDIDNNHQVSVTINNASTDNNGLMSKADKNKLDSVAQNANNYSLPLATSSARGGVKSTTTGTTSGRDYSVEVKKDGTMKVNVPWENTTYGTASSTNYGLVKIGYAQTGKNYPVKLNNSGQMYVTVPWTDTNTDTNTTYGLSWANNTVSLVESGTSSGVTISNFASGITVNGQVQATSFNVQSDKRLKENIKEYKSKNSILDLPIYEFDYKESKIHSIGLIAQDLQEKFPELVDTDDKGYLSIKESKLIYLLINEVKELRDRIEKLENK